MTIKARFSKTVQDLGMLILGAVLVASCTTSLAKKPGQDLANNAQYDKCNVCHEQISTYEKIDGSKFQQVYEGKIEHFGPYHHTPKTWKDIKLMYMGKESTVGDWNSNQCWDCHKDQKTNHMTDYVVTSNDISDYFFHKR